MWLVCSGAKQLASKLNATRRPSFNLARGFSQAHHDPLIRPHGGVLKDLLIKGGAHEDLKVEAASLPSLLLTQRQLCDIELILNGGFSPLEGFMNHDTYKRVLSDSRLPNDLLFPMPITLDVSTEQAQSLGHKGKRVALRDSEGNLIAVLTVEDSYTPDKHAEAEKVFGTTNKYHPGVDFLYKTSPVYLGGKLEGFQLPVHYDYNAMRYTPEQLRNHLKAIGKHQVVGFQTRNPMHLAHRELVLCAAKDSGAHPLIHPVVGMTKPGDIDYHTRVKCYKHILTTLPANSVTLALLPLAMRMGGPREAIWHAIIRKNYGCSHFIVGRDHAGPGDDQHGRPFYEPYAAQEALVAAEKELGGMKILPYQMMVFVKETQTYFPVDKVPKSMSPMNISGTELRKRLRSGAEIPDWFTLPEVVKILRKNFPPRKEQGFTIFFTGLSGSGKSTIANALYVTLLEEGSRPVTLLDGDVVRTHLSSELGFSRDHRDKNVKRIGFVASEVTKSRGAAICAPIAPYHSSRDYVRNMCVEHGGFVEIHVSTPVEVCELRDRKGLYAKARKGELKHFTGLDDPYEVPENPELRIDTSSVSVPEAVQMIIGHLRKEGYLE